MGNKMRPLKIQTSIKEIYMKLPALNYTDEVVFSSNVPEKALYKIINRFKESGIDMRLNKYDNYYIISKKGFISFNTYLMNNF